MGRHVILYWGIGISPLVEKEADHINIAYHKLQGPENVASRMNLDIILCLYDYEQM